MVIRAIAPDPVVDLRTLPGYAQEIPMGNLTGGRHMTDLGTLAGGPQYARPWGPVEARQEKVAREYLQRTEELDRKPGIGRGRPFRRHRVGPHNTQFFLASSVEAKSMYKQRIQTAWGHAAHQGWARLLLEHRRDLIVHGPRATRNAGGKSDDEEQQRHGNCHCRYPEQFHTRASD